MREISLYIHIPFCISKCHYCDFNSYVNPSMVQEYLGALAAEMGRYKDQEYVVKTLYIGGGTPTILGPNQLEETISSVYQNFHVVPGAEFTVEANPGTLTEDKTRVLKDLGVNRISLGLQAYQTTLLKTLGRLHSPKDFEKSFRLLRQRGFSNINADIMFGLPGQGLKDFDESLEKLLLLDPDHISCYSLIIEEGTKFYQLYQEGKLKLPTEDDERTMYHRAIDYLSHRAYQHYEISSFAKEGKRSLHNLTYWKCDDYLGLGAGSHSYLKGQRFFNYLQLGDYIKAINSNGDPRAEIEDLTVEQRQSEFCFMGLRILGGLNKEEFFQRFGLSLIEVFGPEVAKLEEQGLLEDRGRNIKLTSKGLDFANDVFVEFLR